MTMVRMTIRLNRGVIMVLMKTMVVREDGGDNVVVGNMAHAEMVVPPVLLVETAMTVMVR